MNIRFPKFIGRNIELKKIKDHLEQHPRIGVVNIAGGGGVGKTAILGKLREYYESRSNTVVTEIIDFSQTVHQVQTWVIEQIVQTRPKDFQSYSQTKQEIALLPPSARAFYERKAIQAFVDDYNSIAQNQHFVLFFDTIELIQETPLLSFIIETAADLNNTALILAGRRNNDKDFKERLHNKFGRAKVMTLPLKGFTETEADLYFQETKNLPGLEKVGKKIRKNIYILSDGKPILIALALDWLDRGIPFMPEITTLNPDELQRQPDEALALLRAQFEYGLMDGVRKLNSPVDEVVLTMAHLNKRFNREMLEFFFRDSYPHIDLDDIISQLQTLPFVKYLGENYFVLHDEMIRMVQTHVWDATEDPGKVRRRELSVKACQYYDQKLAELTGPEEQSEQIIYWSHRVEQIYYKLYADLEAGYYLFEELFEALVGNQRAELAALAVNFLREYEGHSKYTNLLATFVDGYYTGGVLLSLQRLEEAKKRLEEGEQRLEETLADLKTPQSLDLYLSGRRYLVYHQLGFCYRSLGEWKQAITNYSKSLELTLQLIQTLDETGPAEKDKKRKLLAQIAETQNSLANVYRLTGNFEEARLLCQTSIFLRQSWEPEQVARSQYVMAMILWEMGATAEAMDHLRQAEQSCLPGDETTQALIRKQRAYIFFRTGLGDRAVPLLHEAESVFRRRGQFSELADALNMLSRICREHPSAFKKELDDQDNMELSVKYIEEAHQIADRIGDKFRLAECYLTKAFHYHQWSQINSTKSKRYRNEALKNWRKGVDLTRNRYNRFLSHFSQVRGEIAFRAPTPDYKLAFKEYTDHCKLATEFKRAVYERAIDTLGERLRELGQDNPVLTRGYIRDIIAGWQQDAHLNENYPEIIDELQEIRKSISEREDLEKRRYDYNQAMRRGQWREAIEHCNSILEIPSLYDDENRATVILEKFQAAHRLGDLSQARRLAKVALQIGQGLNSPLLIGKAHLALAQVLWDTTSTAEAAVQLDRAEEAFRQAKDKAGLARVTRHRSYIFFRAGIFDEPRERLLHVVNIFETLETQEPEADYKAELADVLNVLSRINRTDPKNPNYPQSLEYAKRGLEYAKSANDTYRIAECYLSQAIQVHREQDYNEVLRISEEGLKWVSPEMELLRSVYQGIRGAALLQLGLAADSADRYQYWDQAFKALFQELVDASKTKPAGMVRAMNLSYGFFMDLPVEATERYARQVKNEWQRAQLDLTHPSVIRMCDEVIRYRPYIQVREAERIPNA